MSFNFAFDTKLEMEPRFTLAGPSVLIHTQSLKGFYVNEEMKVKNRLSMQIFRLALISYLEAVKNKIKKKSHEEMYLKLVF